MMQKRPPRTTPLPKTDLSFRINDVSGAWIAFGDICIDHKGRRHVATGVEATSDGKVRIICQDGFRIPPKLLYIEERPSWEYSLV